MSIFPAKQHAQAPMPQLSARAPERLAAPGNLSTLPQALKRQCPLTIAIGALRCLCVIARPPLPLLAKAVERLVHHQPRPHPRAAGLPHAPTGVGYRDAQRVPYARGLPLGLGRVKHQLEAVVAQADGSREGEAHVVLARAEGRGQGPREAGQCHGGGLAEGEEWGKEGDRAGVALGEGCVRFASQLEPQTSACGC